MLKINLWVLIEYSNLNLNKKYKHTKQFLSVMVFMILKWNAKTNTLMFLLSEFFYGNEYFVVIVKQNPL